MKRAGLQGHDDKAERREQSHMAARSFHDTGDRELTPLPPISAHLATE
jgi:hypothetical protein